MSKAWPKVRLGEVLRHRKEFITIDDLATYKRLRVQLHAQGILLRDEIPGALIKTKSQQICHTGEFLVAEIDAKVGGFGIVPDALDGAIVSSHYFLFEIDDSKLDRRFLDFFIRTPEFRDQVEAQGTTNYAAIRPSHVLGYEIPLPPVTEQKKIVARIEELAGHIGEVRYLSTEVEHDMNSLMLSAYYRITKNAPRKPLNEVAPLNRRPATILLEKNYPQVAVRSFGKGTFHKHHLSGSEITWQKPFLVKAGDILISNIKAWEGAIAVATAEDNDHFGSHRYLTCVPLRGVATSQFVCFHLLTDEGLHNIGDASPGSADRNRTLNVKALLQIPIPVPSFAEQLWFDDLYHEVHAAKGVRTETGTELDALLPAILNNAFKGRL